MWNFIEFNEGEVCDMSCGRRAASVIHMTVACRDHVVVGICSEHLCGRSIEDQPNVPLSFQSWAPGKSEDIKANIEKRYNNIFFHF